MCFNNSIKLVKIIGNTPKQKLEYFDLYSFKQGNTDIILYVSRKRATKATHIHCTESKDVIWEQFYPFGGKSRPSRVSKYVLKPIHNKTIVTVIVIKGAPGEIIGLDNGCFKSYLSPLTKNNVYLMTERNVDNFFKINETVVIS